MSQPTCRICGPYPILNCIYPLGGGPAVPDDIREMMLKWDKDHPEEVAKRKEEMALFSFSGSSGSSGISMIQS